MTGLEFDNFDGNEDEQYSIWNKQLKKHAKREVRDELDDLEFNDFDYDYEDWN